MSGEKTGPEIAAPPITGAEIVVKALKDQGVDVVFGYPGGAVLPIYDAIFQQNDIRHKTTSATFWSATNRVLPMRPRVTPVPPAGPASCWSLPAPAPPMPSPA
jgi:hypothetical protein